MMGYEERLKTLLSDLVDGRVYPDVTPDVPTFPLIVYDQPGGQAYAYLENRLPDHRHARIQINCVASTRLQANNLAREVERRMIEGRVFNTAEIYGAFQTGYIEVLKMYETRQDFGVWYPTSIEGGVVSWLTWDNEHVTWGNDQITWDAIGII